jgi:hypothetical protein
MAEHKGYALAFLIDVRCGPLNEMPFGPPIPVMDGKFSRRRNLGSLLGKGMLLLGPLGASVGFGVVQGTLILGGQALGLLSGEWRGVTGKLRVHIGLAIGVLVLSLLILALGNSLPGAAGK